MSPLHESSSSSIPPHMVAQRLNNRGAQCIQVGRYELAISMLVKALRISERLAALNPSSQGCACCYCSLEECMSSSCCSPSKNTLQQPQNNTMEACHSTSSSSTKPAHVCSPLHSQSRRQCLQEQQHEEDDCALGGFLYANPIYVSDVSIQYGHDMGITLSLVVIFNLALAHHLLAMAKLEEPHRVLAVEEDEHCDLDSFQLLQKASRLYELAYQLQIEPPLQEAECSSSNNSRVNSIRYTIIVANNLGEVHRLTNDIPKHRMCMEFLLTTIMHLVDCQYPADYIELDGFFRNTSHLVLKKVCAHAA